MKRILLFASMLVGLFSAASCQQEILEPEVNGGVTYEISLPDGPQTKGEDGYATYDLHYEVYRTADANALATTPLLFEKTVTMTSNTTTVTLDLLNDQDYTVLFWANKQGEDYFDLTDLRQVGVKQASANNDDRDAFCGMDKLVQHDGAQSRTVELKRPFAQINIATLVPTVEEIGYDVTPTSSLVKVKNIPVKYNVFTGEPVGDAVEVDYTVNLIPEGNLTVNTTEYKKVAMNYALVPATQDNSATVEVYYEINTVNGTVKNSIPNVPVKKNYRTNIIGNLLTSNATYTIEVKPGFEEGDFYGPEFVKTPAYDEETKTWTITCRDELLYVAQQVNTGANSFVGQTVKVVNDIDLKNIPWTPIGHSTTVTFRGMFEGAAVTKAATEYPTISNLKIENGYKSGFFGVLCNGGKVRNLNFSNVTISGERQLGVVAGELYGNLETPTIENVTVEYAVITAVPALDGAVYDNGDKVGGIAGLIGQEAYIKGCTVKNSTFTGYRDMGGIVGCTQNGHSCNLTGNHSENINFVVTSQFVPYSDNTPHGATGAIRGGTRSNAGDVIEGNTSSEGTISEVVLVNDQVSFQNAINAAGVGETKIQFASDIIGNVNVTVIQKPGVKINIDGDNKKYNGFIKVHSNSNHYADAALTINNVNFETSTVYYDSDNEPYFNFIEALENGSERYSTNITVNGCTFTATGDAINEAVALQIKASKNAKALNCTATGLHSLVQAQSCDETVEVKGCTVNGKNGVAFKQVKAATVEGTTITAQEYGIRFDGNTDNYGIIVKDNTVSAAQPLIVRKMTGANNTIALEGTNTLTTEAEYQIVITKDSDDQPYVKPTGTYTLTGAENFLVYPRDYYYPVATWADFTAGLDANEPKIKLKDNIEYSGNYSLKKDVVIDLNGKSITMPMFYVFSTATIKNGTINGKMYARTGCKVTLESLTYSGTISDNLSTEGHLQVQGGCDVYAKDCVFAATTVNGSQTRSLSIEGSSSGTRKFENCDFKFVSWGNGAGKYKKNVYINTMNGTTTVDFTNCKFNGKAPNILFAGTYSLTNLTMSGCDNTEPTLEINRAKDTVTEVEWAHISSLIANNKFTRVRLFYAGGSSEYIR